MLIYENKEKAENSINIIYDEMLCFVDSSKSPNGYSLLIVSSEDDGTVKIYSTPNSKATAF